MVFDEPVIQIPKDPSSLKETLAPSLELPLRLAMYTPSNSKAQLTPRPNRHTTLHEGFRFAEEK